MKKNSNWKSLAIRKGSGIENQPINQVQWIDRKKLKANSYNPNRVAPRELELLRLSILSDGWTQPIVAGLDMEIADGYHRYLVSGDPDIASLTDGKVPVVFLRKGISKVERMAATVRHNRARGVHGVVPMAGLVGEMIKLGVSPESVQKELGMEEEEVERLAIFGKKGMPKQEGVGEFGLGWEPDNG